MLFLPKRLITILSQLKDPDFDSFQILVAHNAALPVETTTAGIKLTQANDNNISITKSRIFQAMVETMIGADENHTSENHQSEEIFGEVDPDTRVVRLVRDADSHGRMESECALRNSDLETLNHAFSRLAEGHGMMVHKTSDPIQSGAVVRPAETADAQQSTCPYTMSSVDLGENAYPSRLMNATCDCDDCQNGDPVGSTLNLPQTTACQPQFYHVPIIRYQSVRIQTTQCTIRDFTMEFVKIATGCTCVHLWTIWKSGFP